MCCLLMVSLECVVCSRSALNVLFLCSRSALNVMFLCSRSALNVLFLCSMSALNVLFLCSRSALNVLSEKQDSQELDLAALKNELRELREQQSRDKDMILQLQTMASDNGWGIANLKGAQDQLGKDFITFKKLQARQNNTVLQMEEFLSSNDQQHKVV